MKRERGGARERERVRGFGRGKTRDIVGRENCLREQERRKKRGRKRDRAETGREGERERERERERGGGESQSKIGRAHV